MHLTQESSTSSQYTITQSCVAHRLTVSSPPGQPDHTPTRVGVPCVPPHSTYLPRSMNTHSLCTQNALHSPASVQITLAGSLTVTQKSTIPLGSEYRNSTDARRTVRITQYRRRRSKSPARATCPYYRGLRDARRVAVPKTTRAGIAAWRICRYNLDTVPDIHANKAVEAGVQTSCPFQYYFSLAYLEIKVVEHAQIYLTQK